MEYLFLSRTTYFISSVKTLLYLICYKVVYPLKQIKLLLLSLSICIIDMMFLSCSPPRAVKSLEIANWATSHSLFTFMHWRRKWQPTPVFLPGESHGRRSLEGCSSWDCEELDMTERLPFPPYLSRLSWYDPNSPFQSSLTLFPFV